MGDSKNLVTMRKAAQLITNYERFRKNVKQKNFTPVESIQFSIEGMENYLCYVKSLSHLKGVEVTGIRVVNAVYPSDHEDKDKRDQQTVLFIPTYRNEEGKDEAFDPLYIEDGKPLDLGELLKNAEGEGEYDHIGNEFDDTIKHRMLSIRSSEQVYSSFENFGGLGKPPIMD